MCTAGYHTLVEAVLIDVFLLFAFLLFFGASDNKNTVRWRGRNCFEYYLGDDILMQRTVARVLFQMTSPKTIPRDSNGIIVN